MSTRYRVVFESVGPYANGGRYYRGDIPVGRPEEVPDKFWHETVAEHDNSERAQDQFTTLTRWADTGEQLIRNVRLLKAEKPKWIEVEG